MIFECVSPSATRDVISVNERAAMDASASPRYPYAPLPDHPSVSLLVPGVRRKVGRADHWCPEARLTVSLADDAEILQPDAMPVVLETHALVARDEVDPALHAGRAGVESVVRELGEDLREGGDDEGRP
jgi:hypothetical protein